MARPRKRHVQQPIVFPDRNGQWRGVRPRKITKRPGRPPRGPRSSEKHGRREVFRLGTPVHVVLRVSPAIGRLRKHKTYAALREALLVAARRDWILRVGWRRHGLIATTEIPGDKPSAAMPEFAEW